MTAEPDERETAPFLLTTRAGEASAAPTPSPEAADASAADERTSSAPAGSEEVALERLDRGGRRAVRRLVLALVLEALVLASLAGVSLGRLVRDGGGAAGPDALIGAVALVLTLPTIFGAYELARVGRAGSTPPLDARRLARGVGHLRTLFIVKATVLFTTLGLGCFVFSLLAALLTAL